MELTERECSECGEPVSDELGNEAYDFETIEGDKVCFCMDCHSNYEVFDWLLEFYYNNIEKLQIKENK